MMGGWWEPNRKNDNDMDDGRMMGADDNKKKLTVFIFRKSKQRTAGSRELRQWDTARSKC
jgi:hypothetical protein